MVFLGYYRRFYWL